MWHQCQPHPPLHRPLDHLCTPQFHGGGRHNVTFPQGRLHHFTVSAGTLGHEQLVWQHVGERERITLRQRMSLGQQHHHRLGKQFLKPQRQP
jgi:hypothetical protein